MANEIVREGQEQEIQVQKQNYTIGVFPAGIKTITTNGTHDVTEYASVDAQVTPNLQNKEVTITANGSQTVQTDEDYEGMNSVTINTAVAPNLQDKEITITENGPQTIETDSGYDGIRTVNVDVDVSSSNVFVLPNGLKFANSSLTNFDFLRNVSTSEFTSMTYMFYACPNVTELNFSNYENFDTSNVTDMNNMFAGCTSLTSINLSGFDTRNVTTIAYLFYGNNALVNINVDDVDLSNIKGSNTKIYNMFASSYSANITNESLNSILKMLSTCTDRFTNKKLTKLGFSQTMANTCVTLSNWQACVNVGWSTGY